jgi:metallo-beta-lactamase family protein
LLDVSEVVNKQADERGRAAVIRRLKHALEASAK